MCVRACVCVCVRARERTSLYMCVYVYACMHLCVYVLLFFALNLPHDIMFINIRGGGGSWVGGRSWVGIRGQGELGWH